MKKEIDLYKKILKDHGLKITESRLQILNMLFNAGKPVSVQDITKKLRASDPVTVYRVLEQFTKAGIISMVHVSGDRAHFEYAHTHHHHLVCTGCGKIEEIESCSVSTSERTILKHVPTFAQILSHSLEYFGVCKKCQIV